MVYSFSKKFFKGVDILATDKNITMKQFNGTDYDTLYPKTIASQIPDVYSKTETLMADTLSKYGLTSDKLPNDVFQQIKTLIDNAQASADGKAKIQTGSYVGTGTYGASNPCSLTFNFMPKFLFFSGVPNDIITDNTGAPHLMELYYINNKMYGIALKSIRGDYLTVYTTKYTCDLNGNTLSFYSTYDGYPLEVTPNIQGYIYNFCALG